MKRTGIALLSARIMCTALTSRAAAPISVMILDGESGGAYHDWQRVTPVLKKVLDETGLFATTVVTTPPATGDFGSFMPDFAKYQVVVLNYDAPDGRWPAALKGTSCWGGFAEGGQAPSFRGDEDPEDLGAIGRNVRSDRP